MMVIKLTQNLHTFKSGLGMVDIQWLYKHLLLSGSNSLKIPIYQVDAFTSEVFKGNPAAVCPLKEWLPDEVMQNIAMENNLSETAFYIEDNEFYQIRWYTPKAELDLAGHPTLATAHILLNEFQINKNELIFKTKIGDTLKVTINNNLYLMDFPSRPPKSVNEIYLLGEALGKEPIEILAHRDLIAVFNNQNDNLKKFTE